MEQCHDGPSGTLQEQIDKMPKGTPIKSGEKPKRNEPCPCGSGKKYKACCYLKESGNGDVLSRSEAVFGVLAWLTSLQAPLVLGSRHDASRAVMAAGMFCEANNLQPPRETGPGANGAFVKFPTLSLPPISDGKELGPADIPDINSEYMLGMETACTLAIEAIDQASLDQWQISPDVLREIKRLLTAAIANEYAEVLAPI